MGAVFVLFEMIFEDLLKLKFEPIGTFGFCLKFERVREQTEAGSRVWSISQRGRNNCFCQRKYKLTVGKSNLASECFRVPK
jgi:hypothetical protein